MGVATTEGGKEGTSYGEVRGEYGRILCVQYKISWKRKYFSTGAKYRLPVWTNPGRY